MRDLVSGAVAVQGVELTCLALPVEETFFRFARHREWEVSEFSFAKYCSLRAGGEDGLTAIPVFPSRSFRHSAIFVRADGPVGDPAALAGGRIGVPEWTQTATVYARGLLEHEYGVRTADVSWFQAGTNEPGRIEGISLTAPAGISITAVPERTLNEMLLGGDLDAVIAAHAPHAFSDGSGRLVRLFPDHRAVEQEYYGKTGIFPIMHVIALRADAVAAHPWIARNLYDAFAEAKRRGVERALDANAPRYPVPWSVANAEAARELFGPDLWPYGVEPNRPTIQGFLDYALEQGVIARALSCEELFAPATLETFRI